MSHQDAENLVRSIKDRLKSLAKQRGEEVQIVLMRYALERWLYRLSQSDHQERFVLKGAMLFALWSEEPHRATKDLDLLGFGEHSIAALETVCREICRVEVADDGLQMLAETVTGTLIRAEDEYEGVRLTLVALLGRARIPLQIDIGFGDAVTPPPVAIEYPTLLKQPAPHLRAYRRETVIAEKFQVMIEKNIQNSRMKDYYDIWSLARTFDFEGQELAAAITATFQQRQTPLPINLPLALSEEFSEHPVKQTQWRAFVQRGRLRTEACSLSEVVTFLQMFLLPPVTAITAGMDFEQHWTRAKGWH